MTAIGQHQDSNNNNNNVDLDQPQLPFVAPAFNRDNSFQTLKGFSNYSQAQIGGSSQLRQTTSGGFGGGGLGGSGFGAGAGSGIYN